MAQALASGGVSKAAHSNEPALRGVHHLAICVEDLRETVDFYGDVIGLKLVHAMRVPEGIDNWGNPPWEKLRHYFFDMGNDSLLAFFEIPKGARGPADRNSIGAMQHVAFACSPANFDALQERLKARNVRFVGPVENFPNVFSMYVYDPSNIRIEVTCKKTDGSEQRVVESIKQTRKTARKEIEQFTNRPELVDRLTAHLPEN